MSWDFTFAKYTELCQLLCELPCEIMTLAEFLKAGQPRRFILILRHDVDRVLHTASRMAALEAKMGIRSTYYVRAKRSLFDPDVLLSLRQMGHDVGYHYEVLTKARGNRQQALVKFERELEQFRRIVPVETISMHGSSVFPWDNRDLWQTYDFREYGLGEAYLSIDYEYVYYFSDTGRSWEVGQYNIRDRVEGRKPDRDVRTTDDLTSFLRQIPSYPVLINTHPSRWVTGRGAWVMNFVFDVSRNQIKRMVVGLRNVAKERVF